MTSIPPPGRGGRVALADRVEAVDFVNRVNLLFDAWDVDAMVAVFDPGMVVHHPHGTVRGHAELREFYGHYRPLVPGVARHATNHVVDAEDGFVTVRYQMLLVRYAPPDEAERVAASDRIVEADDGLPVLWMYSPMMDRLRREGDGWRIVERRVGGTVRNTRFSPGGLP